MKRWLLVSLVLSLAACDGGPFPPPTPTPTPPPTPTPTPPPFPPAPDPQDIRVGGGICCDNPGTPTDEGYDRGWPLINDLGIEEWKGAVDTIEMRVGPGCDVFDDSPGHVTNLVLQLNEVGITPLLDFWGQWCVKHGLRPDVKPEDVRQCRVPESWKGFVRGHLRELKSTPAKYALQTGNELWLMASNQGVLRCWEQTLIDIIREEVPAAYVVSNAKTGATGIDAFSGHGWYPNTQPVAGPGTWWDESDQRALGCTEFMQVLDQARAAGWIPFFWPGESSTPTRQCVANRLRDQRGVPHVVYTGR